MLIADINLTQFVRNGLAVRRTAGVRVCAVVKADAYGHGAAMMARTAQKFADELAVADLREAAELVRAGIKTPINILGSVSEESVTWNETRGILERSANIFPTVCSRDDISVLKKILPPNRPVNLKINTGMNRLGIGTEELKAVLCQTEYSKFPLKSVFSHLFNAEGEKDSLIQLNRFHACTDSFSPEITRHIAASGCMTLPKEFRLDMVRPGLALYGYGCADVKPILSVRAAIVKLCRVKVGENISYGSYQSPRDMKIAVLGAGYADGLRRKERPEDENRTVSVNGILCPVVGQICMDLTMVDITNASAKQGDYAYIIGGGASGEMLAHACKTNLYEILTGFKGRVKRNYTDD